MLISKDGLKGCGSASVSFSRNGSSETPLDLFKKILRLSWQQEVKRGLSMIVGTGSSKSSSGPNGCVIDD